MKDEIKEILNKLLEYFKESNLNAFGYENDKLISYEEAQILLDYITNLEQENKEIKNTIDFIDNKYKNTINYNEKLIEYNQDYKSRNEKAIKLLKEAGCYDEETKTFCDDVWEELPNLLNILNGGDDNE